MASGLLALLDDIAALLDEVAVMTEAAARQGMAAADDVAAMTKVAAQKTAGGWATTWRSTPSRWPACRRTGSCLWCVRWPRAR